MKKTLGVIGGMGPLATADFYKRLTERTPVNRQEDHFHVIINSHPRIPSRWRHVLYNEPSPVPRIISSIKVLERAGCDFVVLPCNNVHYFYEEVTEHIDIPWMNLIRLVSDSIRHFPKVLILGSYITTLKKLYSTYTDNVVYITSDQNEPYNLNYLMNIVESIKKNKECHHQVQSLLDHIVSSFPDVDAVLLACTELPIAFTGMDYNYNGLKIIDSTEIYIDAIQKEMS